MKKTAVFLLFISMAVCARAQIGGYGIMKFVNLPPSSRVSALGGNLISVRDGDASLAIDNASLLNHEMNNKLALSWMDYVAGINFGSAVYTHDIAKGTGMLGIQYINYGDFTRTDVNGQELGTFTAGEYNIFAGYGFTVKRFSFGGEAKVLYSSLEAYSSLAVAGDLSATYLDTAHNLTVAMVMKNAGYQITTYAGTHEPLPFEIQLGMSIKPKHMPLRLSIIMHDLQRWDFRYINTAVPPQIDIATGNEIIKTMPVSEEIARHFIVGGELLITKNFNIRVGYNHERRKEMTVDAYRGLVGFSYGFGFRVSKFNISYGHAAYSIAGASNTFTIQTNLSEVWHKKK
jgi:hypothetical protein